MCFRADSFLLESNLILLPFIGNPKYKPFSILPIYFRDPQHFQRKPIHRLLILFFLINNELMSIAGESASIPPCKGLFFLDGCFEIGEVGDIVLISEAFHQIDEEGDLFLSAGLDK